MDWLDDFREWSRNNPPEIERNAEPHYGVPGIPPACGAWNKGCPGAQTHSEKSRRKMSLQRQGEKAYQAKLSEQDVLYIREQKKQGAKRRHVYAEVEHRGITIGTFDHVWYNQTWRHLL